MGGWVGPRANLVVLEKIQIYFLCREPNLLFFTSLYTRLTSCTDETVADNQLIFVQ